MNLENIKMAGSVFYYSAVSSLKNEDIYSAAFIVSLYQGLKYRGSLIRGIKGGAAVLGAYAIVNGVMNVMQNIDKIDNYNNSNVVFMKNKKR